MSWRDAGATTRIALGSRTVEINATFFIGVYRIAQDKTFDGYLVKYTCTKGKHLTCTTTIHPSVLGTIGMGARRDRISLKAAAMTPL